MSRALLGLIQTTSGAPPAPFASADSFTVTEGAVADLDVLTNDDNLTGRLITIETHPAAGSSPP